MRILRSYKTSPRAQAIITIALMIATFVISFWVPPVKVLLYFYILRCWVSVFATPVGAKEISVREHAIVGVMKILVSIVMVMVPVSDDGYLAFLWVSLAVLYLFSGARTILFAVASRQESSAPTTIKPHMIPGATALGSLPGTFKFYTLDIETNKQRVARKQREEKLLHEMSSYLRNSDISKK